MAIGGAGTAVIVAVTVGGLLYMSQGRESNERDKFGATNYDDLGKEITSRDDGDIEALVRDFGSHYDEAIGDLQASDSREWDQATLDQAYVALLYAVRIGATSQADSLYWQIDAAGAAGVDIDDNSAGIAQPDREEIRRGIDAQMNGSSPVAEGASR